MNYCRCKSLQLTLTTNEDNYNTARKERNQKKSKSELGSYGDIPVGLGVELGPSEPELNLIPSPSAHILYLYTTAYSTPTAISSTYQPNAAKELVWKFALSVSVKFPLFSLTRKLIKSFLSSLAISRESCLLI